jgi:hypothetical protein
MHGESSEIARWASKFTMNKGFIVCPTGRYFQNGAAHLGHRQPEIGRLVVDITAMRIASDAAIA